MNKYKEARKAQLDIVAMHDPVPLREFLDLMQSITSFPDMSVSKSWSKIQKLVYQNSLESFGKKTHANKDLFEE